MAEAESRGIYVAAAGLLASAMILAGVLCGPVRADEGGPPIARVPPPAAAEVQPADAQASPPQAASEPQGEVAQQLTAPAVNEAEPALAGALAGTPASADGSTEASAQAISPAILKAQILLDRAHFSVGAIDGKSNDNFRKALAAFQSDNGLEATGALDQPSWDKLTAGSSEPVLISYEITTADARGPYSPTIPSEWEEMAKLPRLDYSGPRQAFAERFHMQEELLEALNPAVSFGAVGARITVANVRPENEDGGGNGAPSGKRSGEPRVTRIEVDKPERTVRAFDRAGKLVAFYPASIGTAAKPTPHGTFKVQGVFLNPTYHYDPKFAFPEVKTHQKFSIQGGPNNPVGAAWIDLSAPSYGIHGTPAPEDVGRTGSHGCVRLTNWDVRALASLVDRGAVVLLKE